MIFLPKEQILKIKGEISATIRLIAISKTRPAEDIMSAYSGGQREFGENRPQELTAKYEALPKDIRWHMIGNLQTNKVKYIAPFVAMIQSVNSARLLAEIDKAAAKNGRIIDILLEVAIADEDTKQGWELSDLTTYLESRQWQNYANVRFCGVMGMATYTDDNEHIKQEFLLLKDTFLKFKDAYFNDMPDFKEISMGMSGDYKLAIECGSTMIRIGSSIFQK